MKSRFYLNALCLNIIYSFCFNFKNILFVILFFHFFLRNYTRFQSIVKVYFNTYVQRLKREKIADRCGNHLTRIKKINVHKPVENSKKK